MKKFLALVLSLVMLLGICTGCGGGTTGGSDSDEVIFKVAINSGYDTLNPFTTESMMVYDFLNFCCDSLIAYDADFNAVPRLAESWEPSEDGLSWTFHLRQDAVFSDGEPVTSADVKWTYENAIDSYMYSTHASGFTSIECPDDYTVVFNCESPKPDMLYQIIPILPEHIWSQVDILTYEPTELVGSGPFTYDPSRSANGNIAFVRNDNYWGQKPYVDVLVFSVYDNYDTMAQAMQLGEMDACYELDRTQYDTLSADPNTYVELYESFGEEHLAYNMLNEVTGDQTIRYAIDYCFDRDSAVEMGYGGLAEAGYGLVNNPGFKYVPADDIKRELSIEKANALLDDAGYLDTDGDGIRERNGQPLSLELITASERSSWQSAVVNMLITNCAQAGIEINWTTLEKVTMWDTCCDGDESWQLYLDGWGGDVDPGMILCLFQDWETGGGYSTTGYSNPDYDAAYAEVFATIDADERAAAIEKCQTILYEDCPYTIICYDTSVQAISNRWTGFPNGIGLFANERVDTYVNVRPAE